MPALVVCVGLAVAAAVLLGVSLFTTGPVPASVPPADGVGTAVVPTDLSTMGH